MSENRNLGKYFWRGGQRIELEKEEEYFTAILRDRNELEKVRSLPGVSAVKSVQNKIFKVRVSKDQLDKAMDICRSEEIKAICHHAYRPKGATNTRYNLIDQIVVKFKPDVSTDTLKSILSAF